MKEQSVYQSAQWKQIKQDSGKEPADTEMVSFILEKKLPFVGNRRILFAEGTPKAEKTELKHLLIDFKTKAQKYYYGTIMPTLLDEQKEIFEDAGFYRVVNHTILINLTRPEEELYKNLEKKSARWGVNFAKKQGLVFLPAQERDLEKFYKLYVKTARDGGFTSENKKFLELTRETNISRLFVIKKGEDLIAGGLILLDTVNSYAILNLTSSTKEGNQSQAMPFLYWNLMLFAKSSGLKYLDFGGYDLESKPGDKTYHINKFKERFGGEVVEQPIYSTSRRYLTGRKVYALVKRFR